MKIDKSPKRLSPLPQSLDALIKQLTTAESLSDVLAPLLDQPWNYSKTDLFHWIPVLNRMDEFLGEIVKKYNLPYQSRPFEPQDQHAILVNLAFTRILWENSTNRALYSSYDHLTAMLGTTDLNVLLSVLKMLYRPAQRIASTRSLKNTFGAAQDSITTLALSWTPFLPSAASLLDLASPNWNAPDSKTVHIQYNFYRSENESLTTPVETSSSSHNQSAGWTFIVKPVSDYEGSKDYEILQKLKEEFNVPDVHLLNLLNRIRVCLSLHNHQERSMLLACRFYSIAILSNLVTEDMIQQKIFLAQADFINQLAEILAVTDVSIDQDVCASALAALDSIAHYRTYMGRVLAAVGAATNYGTLMRLCRQAVTTMEEKSASADSSQSRLSVEFLEILFAFLSFVSTTPNGANMLIGSGLIPCLLSSLAVDHPSHIRNVVRCVNILDTTLYNYPSSFNSFMAAQGVDIVIDRIAKDVEDVLKISTDGNGHLIVTSETCLPLDPFSSPEIAHLCNRVPLLRANVKFILHLMQSNGSAEGLRSLIDSKLPSLVAQIFQYSHLFGVLGILGLAMNIMSAFVHNEPTTLPILQEARIPHLFLESVSRDPIPVSAEVVSAIPNAFGAICLNQAGLDSFLEMRPMPPFLKVFTSEEHARALQDNDVPHLIGNSVDEFIRHHPSVKEHVISSIIQMLDDVVSAAADAKPEDWEMTCLISETHPLAASDKEPQNNDGSKVSLLVDVSSRFLEGLFQNTSHCKEFLKMDGATKLLQLLSLPTLSLDFSTSMSSYSLSYLFRVMVEVSAKEFAPLMRKEIVSCMKDLEPLFSRSLAPARDIVAAASGNNIKIKSDIYEDYVPLKPEHVETAQIVFRALMKLQNISRLFSDLYFTHSLSHMRGVTSIIALFSPEDAASADQVDSEKGNTDGDMSLMNLFGKLYTSCLAESIFLAQSAPSEWIEPKPKSEKKSGETRELYNTNADLSSIGDANISPVSVEGVVGDMETMDQDPRSEHPADHGESSHKKNSERAKEKNTRAFAFLLKEITTSVSSVFKGVLKQVGTRRRITDAELKKSSANVMNQLAATCASFLKLTQFQSLSGDGSPESHISTLLFRLDYLRDVLSLIGTLVVDERSGFALHTSFFLSFEKYNGLDLMFATFKEVLGYLRTLESLYKTEIGKQVDAKKRIDDAMNRGMKVVASCLNTWQILTNHKSIHDSPYTTALVNQRSHPFQASSSTDSSTEKFDAYLFLRRMRIRCFPFVYRVWAMGSKAYQDDDDKIELSIDVGIRLWKDEKVFSFLSKIILQYLDSQGEVNPSSASNGSNSLSANGLPSTLSSLAASLFGRPMTVGSSSSHATSASDAASGLMASLLQGTLGAASPTAPIVPDPTKVEQLQEMGFPRPAAEAALRRYGNNLERAADYLLSHPEVVATATFGSSSSSSSAPAAGETVTSVANTADPGPSSSSNDPVIQQQPVASESATENEGQSNEMDGTAPAQQNQPDSDEQMDEVVDDDNDDEWEDADDDEMEEDDDGDVSMDQGRPPTDAELAARSKDKGKAVQDESEKEFSQEILKPLREKLKSSLLPIALRLLDEAPNHIFNIKDLVSRIDLPVATESIFREINDLRSHIIPNATTNLPEKKSKMDALGNRIRLLAFLLTTESTSKSPELIQDNENLKSLLNLILSPLPEPSDSHESPAPEYEKLGVSATGLASLLLLLETYLAVADEPPKVPFLYAQDNNNSFGIFAPIPKTIPASESSKDDSETGNGENTSLDKLKEEENAQSSTKLLNLSQEDRIRLLERLVYLLGSNALVTETDISHSILRLLVRLTRRHEMALHFATQTPGLKYLFQPSLIASFNAQPHLTICILRHIVDSESVILEAMERELFVSFSSLRAKSMDLSALLRVNAHLIVRNPDNFIKSVANLVKFGPGSSSPRTRMLVLKSENKTILDEDDDDEPNQQIDAASSSTDKKDTKPVPKPLAKDETTTLQTQKVVEDSPMSQTVREEILSFLTNEVIHLKSQPLNVQLPPQPSSQNLDETLRLASETKLAHVRRCFILQCLTELSMSYPACRLSLINITQRRQGNNQAVTTPSATPFTTPVKPGGGKLRNSFLAHLLFDLLPRPIESSEEIKKALKDPSSRGLDVRMKMVESNIAQSLLCALCLGSTRHDAEEESQIYPELDFVRKSVLEWILKAFKDTSNNENLSLEKKCERWYSYGQLINHALLVKPSSTTSSGQNGNQLFESHQMHLGRLMLEKGFVSIMTNTLSGFDLHHPLTKDLAAGLVAPLSTLTNLAIKMGKAGDSGCYSPRASESKKSETASRFASATTGEPTSSENLPSVPDMTPTTTPSRNRRVDEGLIEDEDDELLIPAEPETASDTDVNEISEIYRNSALGMLQPNQGFSDQDEMGLTDEDDSGEDDDIEFDDESEESMDDDMGEQDSEEDDDMEIVVPQPYHNHADHHEDVSDEEESESDDPDVIHNADVDEEQIIDMQWTDVDESEEDETEEGDDEGEEDEEEDEEDEEVDEDVVDTSAMPTVVADALDQALGVSSSNRIARSGIRDSYGDMDDDEGSYESMSDADDDDIIEDFELDNGNLMTMVPIGQPSTARPGREIFHLDVAPERADPRWPGMESSGPSGLSYLEQLLGGPSRAPGGGIRDDFEIFSRPLGPSQGLLGMPGTDSQLTRHPLLSPQSASRSGTGGLPPSSVSSRPVTGLGSASMNGIIDLRVAPGDSGNNAVNALRILEEIFGRNRMAADSLRIETRTTGGRHGQEIIATIDGDPNDLDRIARAVRDARNYGRSRGSMSSVQPDNAIVSSLESNHDITIVHSFAPQFSCDRWKFEAKLLYGTNYSSKSSWVQNSILNILIPPAKEEDRIRKEKQKKKEEEAAQKRAKEEEERKAKLAAEEAEKKRKADEEAAAKAKAEEEERLKRIQDDAEQQTESNPVDASAEVASASAEPRVIITIHGNPVDITGTGIDITFLEALPDDLRQEVVTNHLRDLRRSQNRTSNAPISSTTAAPSVDIFSEEFLNALPEEIRREVVQQDEAARNRSSGNTTGGPTDMDLASFLASLDPSLRQQVLLEQDDSVLSGLPSNLLAEATSARNRSTFISPLMYNPSTNTRGANSTSEGQENRESNDALSRNRGQKRPHSKPSSPPAKRPREAVQLLDRPGVVSILRLIFVQDQDDCTAIHEILSNLSANSKSRFDLVSILLAILSDDSHDLAAVDRNFAKLTIRNQKSRHNLPPATPGSVTTPSIASSAAVPTPSAMSPTYTEDAPNLVILRAMDALTHLVTSSPLVVQYFLKERPAEDLSFKTPKSVRKKGKERASLGGNHAGTNAMYLPFSSLLNLLEKQKYLEDPSILEQLMNLLATVCKRLSALAKRPAAGAEKVSSSRKTVATDNESAPIASSSRDKSISDDQSMNMSQSQASANISKTEETLSKLSTFISTSHLRLVCNVLKDGVCSSKSFQYTLYVLQTLTLLPGKIEIITQELKDSIMGLCQQLTQELDELHQVSSKAQVGADVEGSCLSAFSSPSSTQARLLRLLKTVDFLHYKSNAISIPDKAESSPAQSSTSASDKNRQKLIQEKASHEKLLLFYNQIGFSTVWSKLGMNLVEIEKKESLTHISTVLLPLIESFMVVAKPFVFVKKIIIPPLSDSSKPIGLSRQVSMADVSSDEQQQDAFVSFTEEHKKLLNIMVRNNPSLMNGSFSLLVHNPKVLEFDNKRTYFNQQLHKKKDRQHHSTLPINVRRQYVFEDSYHQLQGRTGEEIKYAKLAVRFHEEEGLDAGGVTREWFSALARQMFNPDYALFRPSAADKVTYQPNRASGINPDHLLYFKFVGRIIGKAIYDGRLLDAYFTRSFYKCILELPVDYKDIEAVDPEYHKSLEWMLNNDITDILDFTFSVELDDFGKRRIVELIPDGKNIPVTEENKVEYVKLISEQRLVLAIKDQIQAFLSGFHEIIPKDLVKIFNEQELELLISGLPDIDVDDWKNNTEYVSYSSSSPTIQWFWRAVRSFSQEERAKLIQFVTGTSKVPLEGFARLQGSSGVQKFQIHKDFASTTRLPSAHTCFNQLDLPEYESYEQLRSLLLKAISECSTGFGFA